MLISGLARPPCEASASVAATSRQTALQMSAADPWQAAAMAHRLAASSTCRVSLDVVSHCEGAFKDRHADPGIERTHAPVNLNYYTQINSRI